MVQCQILNKIIQTKDSSIILLNNLTADYFSDYGAEFNFIKTHMDAYGVIPDPATFVAAFPDFDYIEVKEPTAYLLDELVKDYNKRHLAAVFTKVKHLVESNKVEEAMSYYVAESQKVSKAISLQTVDITKDTSRYDAYVERANDFSKFYVKTGFKEIDAIIGGWDRQEELATIVARPGVGKCLAKGTRVLMADGTTKCVEDIVVGDKVQSEFGANTVLALHNGRSKGFRVIPRLGDSFVVSENHLLTIAVADRKINEKGNETTTGTSTLVDIPIEDWMRYQETHKSMDNYRLYRPSVNYPEKKLLIDPYILGLWLGDGTSCRSEITTMDSEIEEAWECYANSFGYKVTKRHEKNSQAYSLDMTGGKSNSKKKNIVIEALKHYNVLNNKHIPLDYLTGSEEQRLQLLAGILDTDGYLSTSNGFTFSLQLKLKLLVEQVAQLARGLGFRVGKITAQNIRIPNSDRFGTYYSVNIGGDLQRIPTRLPRKNAGLLGCTKKRWNVYTRFRVEPIDEIEYYGFMADGDHRYLLADNTLTHNTWLMLKCAVAAAEQGLKVGIYSGEMSERKVGYRFDTLVSHISNSGIMRGVSSLSTEYKQYMDSLATRFKNGVRVLTPNMINGAATVTALRAFIEKEELDILFVDQHSLLEDQRGAKNPIDRASNISRDLKQLQVLKKIPIIAVSQQNRESTENGVSTSNVAQTDRISQDSTVLIFIEQKDNVMTLTLGKSRDSVTGKRLSYAVDLDHGIFDYIPEENNGVSGAGSEELRREFEGDEPF